MSPQIAHQISRQLPVFALLGSRERLHDLLVVMHDLSLSHRHVRPSFLPIEPLSLCCAITEMLNLPPFVGRPVNPARGRGLDAMLS